jgi:predicted dehydrogenase
MHSSDALNNPAGSRRAGPEASSVSFVDFANPGLDTKAPIAGAEAKNLRREIPDMSSLLVMTSQLASLLPFANHRAREPGGVTGPRCCTRLRPLVLRWSNMTNRRKFFQSICAPAAVSAFPTIVKASALGLNGAVAPSNRVVMATIGCGNMGNGHLGSFLKLPEVQVVALCDLDEEHLLKAKDRVDKQYRNKDCMTYRAFEEVQSRRDIDAVSMAVPDHWHGVVAFSALRAGKDVYGEKPLAHNFAEGRDIVEAVARYKRIWQSGSWQRSKPQFHQACELVRNGRIGKVHRVEVGLPSGHGKKTASTAFVDPPATFLYDRWLGPGPEVPYCEARTHWNWRWNLAFGGGQLMDWVGHHNDIAHWGLGLDDTGPYEVEGKGEYPPSTEVWNSATKFYITSKYAGDITIVIAGGYPEIRSGTKWIGDGGWIWVDRSGIQSEPANLLTSEIQPGEIHLTKSDDHYKQFIQCVKSREETITPAHVSIRSVTPGWLGQIAMLTGRKIQWDPKEQRILDDPEAAKMLSRDMRMPWRLV